MAQKEAQLKQWLDIDDKQLASAMEKDAAFAEFENKNEEAFQALQKMKAEEFDKDAEFEKETRRLQKASSSEKQAIIAEEIAARKDASDKAIQILDKANNERLSKLTDQYVNEGMSEQKFQAEQLATEQAYLILKKALLEQYGQSTVEVDNQINQKRIEAQKNANSEFAKTMSDFYKENDSAQAEEAKIQDQALDELIKRTNESIYLLNKLKDDEAKSLEQRKQKYLDFASAMGQTFGDLLSDQKATMEDYLKAALVMSLDALHQFLLVKQAEVMIDAALGAATGRFWKVAAAVAAIAAMEAAYQGVRGALTKKSGSKQSGGFAETSASDSTPMGTYHANEFIGSASTVRNPSIRKVYQIIDLAQKQGKAATLNLPAVMASMGMGATGMQAGGFASASSSAGSLPERAAVEGGLSASDALKLTYAIERLLSWDPAISIELLERRQNLYNKVTKGGLKG